MRLLILTFRPDEWPIAVKELLCITKPGDFVQLLESDTEILEQKVNTFYKSKFISFATFEVKILSSVENWKD
ncbi:hypothetical protein RMATCC62417_16903 [Rhizopus microsporus]|nr:hypothetical protein RMATCC62417_16903 [Rhizopus microsporus]